MNSKFFPFKPSREIYDVEDFNSEASTIFEYFLKSFTEDDGLIRKVRPDETDFEPEPEFMYTMKGMRLADRMMERLFDVGAKYFNPDDIEIDSLLYQDV